MDHHTTPLTLSAEQAQRLRLVLAEAVVRLMELHIQVQQMQCDNQRLRRAVAGHSLLLARLDAMREDRDHLHEIVEQQRRAHRYDAAALDALILSNPLQYGWLKAYRREEEENDHATS